jgi:hypothetical protein
MGPARYRGRLPYVRALAAGELLQVHARRVCARCPRRLPDRAGGSDPHYPQSERRALDKEIRRRVPISPSSNANTVLLPWPMPSSAARPCAASRSPMASSASSCAWPAIASRSYARNAKTFPRASKSATSTSGPWSRTLLHELFATAGEIRLGESELHITLAPLSSLHRTYAAQALCEILDQTATIFPGSPPPHALRGASATAYWARLPRLAGRAQRCHGCCPGSLIGIETGHFCATLCQEV